ncbi:MAG: hypothetical protein WC775_04080 [Patescibacteria group bacterium]|jgi:hypothetical protein
MVDSKQVAALIEKVKKMEKSEKLDLSSGEDLSIAVMNLISIEEHLFFSGGKTGNGKYYGMLNEVRKMRTELMKGLVKDTKGEEWCISKHFLAASMRIMEVGTKALKKGDAAKAHDLFNKSYQVYNLFWGIILGLTDTKGLRNAETEKKEQPLDFGKNTLFAKVSSVVGKVLDCCRE